MKIGRWLDLLVYNILSSDMKFKTIFVTYYRCVTLGHSYL